MDVENKTSDEILQELFSALNVPLSPKVKEEQPSDNQDNSLHSEGNEDKGADSKSSESEAESKGQKEQVTKNHKHKTSKKKKEKKKKKKKHKKKDDDGRHKSKKKRRKAQESPPVVKVQKVEVESKEEVIKITDVIVEQTEKLISNNEVSNVEVKGEELTNDPCPKEEVNKTLSQNGKRKSDTNSDSGDKEDTSKKPTKKLKSPLRSHSSSKSLRSRSRSPSRVRQRHSRSRSHQGRHTRSRSRQGRHSRSRSHSRSKHGSRHSRSSSRKKSSAYKSKAKSPAESDKLKHRRSSRSCSRSHSPRSSRKRRYSKSRSRSPSSKNAKRKLSRSHSKSLSPKYSRRKRYHSPSLSPVKASKRRSRSRSGSHKKVVSKEISDTLTKASESSSKVNTLKKTEKSLEIDLSSIPTPDVQQSLCPATLPISLESIPLPVPPISTEVQDPSSIPLPQPAVPCKEQLNGKDHSEDNDKEIDLGTIPVPGYVSETSTKEQEPLKPTDTGVEKSKAKTIIIKSLKDSLIYLQAQEEAERRAKVKQNDDEEVSEKIVEKSNGKLEDTEMKDQKTESKTEEEEEEEEEEEATEESVKEPQEEESSAPKKSTNSDQYEVDEGEIVVKNGNEVEDGEIVSENDNEETTKTKSHKKKSKKDKDKSKEKKKSKREKTKEKKKQAKERSKSKERSVKSRSRSKERSKHRKSSSSWHRDRDVDRRYRRYSRSRSHSRDRHSRFRRRSYSRSRSRSRSRSGRKGDCVSDLRDKVTRKRLLEIARRNAVYLMQNGCLPPSVEQEQLVKIKTGGKSVEELTDFCKQLVASGNYSDAELSDPSPSSDEDDNNPDKPFSCTRHPFSVRDSKPILMNIRNAPMLPTKTNAERLADHAKLREQFPVSSGSQHRNKGEVNTTEDKLRTESGWVPVSPKEKNKKEEDSVFSKEKVPAVDISQIVSSRLSAMRKLQDNPNDMEALKTLHNVQKDMQTWALSKQEPGQFTGSTGVKILSQEELSAGQQAWVRKEQFKEAAPVRPQFGLKMLQKMGWTPGEGLGKNKEGAIEPLLLDVKMDKKGFHAQEELTPKKQPIPMAKDLSGKHPVSALVELCSKHKWQPPEFEMVFDYGPDHKKNFLMKVKVNGQEYKPAVAGPTKKLAKANAAAACLQSLGLLTKDPENPLTEAS